MLMFLNLCIVYLVTIIIDVNLNQFILGLAAIILLTLLMFMFQRARGTGTLKSLFLFPFLFVLPDKYKYDYNLDVASIVLIIVFRVLKVLASLIIIGLLIIVIRLNFNSIGKSPEFIQKVAYSNIVTGMLNREEKEEHIFSNGAVKIKVDDTLDISPLSEGNVLVLDYKNKYVEVVLSYVKSGYHEWTEEEGFYRNGNATIKIYNATEEETKSILEKLECLM